MVTLERPFQRKHHLTSMLIMVHIDKINNDDAAQIAQTKLPCNRLHCLKVGLVDRLFQCTMTDKSTGIHIDSGHGFSLVDDQVTT